MDGVTKRNRRIATPTLGRATPEILIQDLLGKVTPGVHGRTATTRLNAAPDMTVVEAAVVVVHRLATVVADPVLVLDLQAADIN